MGAGLGPRRGHPQRGRFGGCGGGGFQVVTMGATWAVMAHEFGHGAGGLADEYCRRAATPARSPARSTSRRTTPAPR
ncbi:hypothetical protein NKG05_30100 [Oerskovia sp. M15]